MTPHETTTTVHRATQLGCKTEWGSLIQHDRKTHETSTTVCGQSKTTVKPSVRNRSVGGAYMLCFGDAFCRAPAICQKRISGAKTELPKSPNAAPDTNTVTFIFLYCSYFFWSFFFWSVFFWSFLFWSQLSWFFIRFTFLFCAFLIFFSDLSFSFTTTCLSFCFVVILKFVWNRKSLH